MFFRLLLLIFIIPLFFTGCKKKKNVQYAGVDGDYVNQTSLGENQSNQNPLPERNEGENFFGANVSRGAYQPVYFPFDSTSITHDQDSKIQAVISAVQENGKNVIIAGFTDERGTEEYNRGLGERRALAVREVLIAKGLNASQIQTVSFGKEMPVDPEHTDVAWAKNRRAEFGLVK